MAQRTLLGISDQAKTQILSVLKDYRPGQKVDLIPALVWVDNNLNPHLSKSFITIGAYDNRSEIENDIVVIDGLEIVMAITDADIERFEGKTLHFEDGEFVLLDHRP